MSGTLCSPSLTESSPPLHTPNRQTTSSTVFMCRIPGALPVSISQGTWRQRERLLFAQETVLLPHLPNPTKEKLEIKLGSGLWLATGVFVAVGEDENPAAAGCAVTCATAKANMYIYSITMVFNYHGIYKEVPGNREKYEHIIV